MIFADASPSPKSVYDFLQVVGYFLTFATAIVAIIVAFRKQKVTVEPDPMVVRKQAKRYNHDLNENLHTEHKRRLDSHEKEIGELWNAVRVDVPAMERRLNEAGEERSTKIHDRINEILEAVSEVRGQIK